MTRFLTRLRLLALLLPLALAACESARDCARDVPTELRADVIRYAMDKGLVERELLSEEEVVLATAHGTAAPELSEERERAVVPRAVGFASCVRERTWKGK